MTRKQHKRGNISKQHKDRENSREMLFDVSYKSDTMSTNGRAAGVQNIVLNQSALLCIKVVQQWRVTVATWWRGEVNICEQKIFHSWKNILTKCVDNHINTLYYKIEARVKTKPILYNPIFILPHFKLTPYNIEERQVIPNDKALLQSISNLPQQGRGKILALYNRHSRYIKL